MDRAQVQFVAARYPASKIDLPETYPSLPRQRQRPLPATKPIRAQVLQRGGYATLLIDLLTRDEDAIDEQTREYRFDVDR